MKECTHPKWCIEDGRIVCRMCGVPHPEANQIPKEH